MTASNDFEILREQVARELAMPTRPNVAWLAREIAEHHGEGVLGVLFYGSCLRKETDEGVLDFWVVVDDYRSAHSSRIHALANPVAPPSVYFIEREHDGVSLRSKYGVIDRRDFERGTSIDARTPYVWARFSQPARLLEARDDDARSFCEAAIANAIVTFVARSLGHLPDQRGLFRFSLAAFWTEAFARTYDSERRPESDDYSRNLYLEDAERYDFVAAAALRYLAATGFIEESSEHPRSFAIRLPPRQVRRLRRRWQIMRRVGRTIGLVRLLKTAFTFGDWVPYVLWKLERHTGRKIELTPRQREHPLIFAWPIILPLILRRNPR